MRPPTYTDMTYAPLTLRWNGLGATHATELFGRPTHRTRFYALLTAAVPTAVPPFGSATRCNVAGAVSAKLASGRRSPAYSKTTVLALIAGAASSSIRISTAGSHGTVFAGELNLSVSGRSAATWKGNLRDARNRRVVSTVVMHFKPSLTSCRRFPYALRWRRTMWLHVPAVIWGIGIAAKRVDCPLTCGALGSRPR